MDAAAAFLEAAQQMGVIFGSIVAGGGMVIYGAHTAIKRVFPPKPERRSDDADRENVWRRLDAIGESMHQAAIALQHASTVQDEIVATLRENRDGWMRTTTIQKDLLNNANSTGELLAESHDMLRVHAEEDRLGHLQIKADVRAASKSVEDLTDDVRLLLRSSTGNGG